MRSNEPDTPLEVFDALQRELREQKAAVAAAHAQLGAIHASNAWRLVGTVYRTCHRLMPERSLRLRATRKAIRGFVRLLRAS